MDTLLLVMAIATAVGTLVVLVVFARGARTIPELKNHAPLATGPLVSVVFAARDEGPNIEQALSSLLAQKYSPIEIVAVNDRSVDDTAAVLQRMAGRDSRIR